MWGDEALDEEVKSQSKVKVKKSVEERRKRWKKFGQCAGLPEGVSDVMTSVAKEDVFLVLGEEERKQKQQAEEEKRQRAQVAAMYQNLMSKATPNSAGGTDLYRPPQRSGQPSTSTTAATTPARSDVYVPPRMRGKMGTGATFNDGEPTIEETSRIHVTNLAEEITEYDLRDKFSEFGNISKVYVVKDKETGESKGSAFITFFNRDAAKAAMERLNGQGWMSLIMNIERARPSGPRS